MVLGIEIQSLCIRFHPSFPSDGDEKNKGDEMGVERRGIIFQHIIFWVGKFHGLSRYVALHNPPDPPPPFSTSCDWSKIKTPTVFWSHAWACERFESSQKSKRSRSIVDVNEAPLLKHKEPLLNDLLTFNPTNRKEPPHDCVVLIENQSKKCYYLYKKVYVTVFWVERVIKIE